MALTFKTAFVMNNMRFIIDNLSHRWIILILLFSFDFNTSSLHLKIKIVLIEADVTAFSVTLQIWPVVFWVEHNVYVYYI